ncbi:hypothetical protein RN001_005755 [Aquatica leii]|uniref:MADF domain-containing protein n=1 Tax=Aquatica leii TaxID=1421715 RepID=A0AAN7SAS6_9COLE|nr:hypothetical protein RN001_005755 [Aquatica leii]
MFIESLSVDGVLSLFKNGLLNPDEIRSAAEVINAKLNRGVDSVSPGNVVLYKCFNEIASRITAVSNVVEQPQRSNIVNSTSMSGQPKYQEQPLNLCGTANNQTVGDTLQSENMRLDVHPQNLSNRMHHEVGETPRSSTSRNNEDHFNTHQAVSIGSNRGILHGGGVRQREGFSYITVMTETDRFIRRFNMTAKTVIFSFKPVDADNPFEWLKAAFDELLEYVTVNAQPSDMIGFRLISANNSDKPVFNKETIRYIVGLVTDELTLDNRGCGTPPQLQVLIAIPCWGRRDISLTQADFVEEQPTNSNQLEAEDNKENENSRLVDNETKNRAELYMQIVARFNSDKRLNLIQCGSFQRRATLSGLRYNRRVDWQYKPWKKILEESPGSNFKTYLHNETNSAERRKFKRKLVDGRDECVQRKKKSCGNTLHNTEYGSKAEDAKPVPIEVEIESKRLLQKLQNSDDDVADPTFTLDSDEEFAGPDSDDHELEVEADNFNDVGNSDDILQTPEALAVVAESNVLEEAPLLWESHPSTISHRDYKNSKKKEQAWVEISEITNLSVEDCMRLWKNLRDRFTREKRLKPSGSEGGDSNWVYYEKMAFYNKCTRPRKTHTSMQASTSKQKNLRKELTPRPASSSSSGWSGIETILSPQSEGEVMEDSQETMNLDETVVSETTPRSKKGNSTSKKGEEIANMIKSCNQIVAAIENK